MMYKVRAEEGNICLQQICDIWAITCLPADAAFDCERQLTKRYWLSILDVTLYLQHTLFFTIYLTKFTNSSVLTFLLLTSAGGKINHIKSKRIAAPSESCTLLPSSRCSPIIGFIIAQGVCRQSPSGAWQHAVHFLLIGLCAADLIKYRHSRKS